MALITPRFWQASRYCLPPDSARFLLSREPVELKANLRLRSLRPGSLAQGRRRADSHGFGLLGRRSLACTAKRKNGGGADEPVEQAEGDGASSLGEETGGRSEATPQGDIQVPESAERPRRKTSSSRAKAAGSKSLRGKPEAPEKETSRRKKQGSRVTSSRAAELQETSGMLHSQKPSSRRQRERVGYHPLEDLGSHERGGRWGAIAKCQLAPAEVARTVAESNHEAILVGSTVGGSRRRGYIERTTVVADANFMVEDEGEVFLQVEDSDGYVHTLEAQGTNCGVIVGLDSPSHPAFKELLAMLEADGDGEIFVVGAESDSDSDDQADSDSDDEDGPHGGLAMEDLEDRVGMSFGIMNQSQQQDWTKVLGNINESELVPHILMQPTVDRLAEGQGQIQAESDAAQTENEKGEEGVEREQLVAGGSTPPPPALPPPPPPAAGGLQFSSRDPISEAVDFAFGIVEAIYSEPWSAMLQPQHWLLLRGVLYRATPEEELRVRSLYTEGLLLALGLSGLGWGTDSDSEDLEKEAEFEEPDPEDPDSVKADLDSEPESTSLRRPKELDSQGHGEGESGGRVEGSSVGLSPSSESRSGGLGQGAEADAGRTRFGAEGDEVDGEVEEDWVSARQYGPELLEAFGGEGDAGERLRAFLRTLEESVLEAPGSSELGGSRAGAGELKSLGRGSPGVHGSAEGEADGGDSPGSVFQREDDIGSGREGGRERGAEQGEQGVFYKLVLTSVSLMCSNGDKKEIKLEEWSSSRPDFLANSSSPRLILERANGAERARRCMKALVQGTTGKRPDEAWMSGIDHLGIDLRVRYGTRVEQLRFPFRHPATSERSAERLLDELLRPRRVLSTSSSKVGRSKSGGAWVGPKPKGTTQK